MIYINTEDGKLDRVNVFVDICENAGSSKKSQSKVYKIYFDNDKKILGKLRKAEKYILTNDKKTSITYRKAGLNDYTQKDTVVDFVFNYNNFEKPI